MYWFFFYPQPHSPTYSVSFALLVPPLADPTDRSSNCDLLPSGFRQGSTNGNQQQEHMFPVFLPCCVTAWVPYLHEQLPSSVTPALSEHPSYCFPTCLSDLGCQWFLPLLVSGCLPFFVSVTLPTSLSRIFHKILFKQSGEYSALYWDSGLHNEKVIDKGKGCTSFGL